MAGVDDIGHAKGAGRIEAISETWIGPILNLKTGCNEQTANWARES